MGTNIQEYSFNTRAMNVLRRNGITDIKELSGLTLSAVSLMRGMGPDTLNNVLKVLTENGIELKKAPGFYRKSKYIPFTDSSDLELPNRIANMLKRAGIMNMETLKTCSYAYLMKNVRGFGPVSKKELSKYLKKYGITLSENT